LHSQPFTNSHFHFRILLNRRHSVARTTRVTSAEVSGVRCVASHFCAEGSRLATDQFVWIAEAILWDSVPRYDVASVGNRFQTFRRRMRPLCVIAYFRRVVNENCALVGCYAARSGNFLQTLRDNPSVTFYKAKNPKNTYLPTFRENLSVTFWSENPKKINFTDDSGQSISHVLKSQE
jgi:hypothetical protein